MLDIPVRVRDCTCPGTPHETGDFVYLSPTLPLEGGLTAEQQMLAVRTRGGTTDELTRLWMGTFIRYGATGWNFEDENGPVPFDVDVVLRDYSLARPVAEKAADLGWDDLVVAPFLTRPAKPSPTGRTTATTSARRSRTPTPSASPSPTSSEASPPSTE